MSAAPTSSRERWSSLDRPGVWFWALVVIGLALRMFLATATRGSTDVELWRDHARGVNALGLVRYYDFAELFNHPPPIGWAMARLWQLARSLDLSFAFVFRTVTSLADLGNVALIARVLRGSRWRWLAAGGYCVAPVPVILSGHHGNTDVLVATCLLGCVLLAARQRAVACGALLGVCAWIKLPGLLAAPAIGFAFSRWRDRVVCALTATIVGAAPLVWIWLSTEEFVREHPRRVQSGDNVVLERVLGYRGSVITEPGIDASWLWGLRNFIARVWGQRAQEWPAWAWWWEANSAGCALALIVLLAFLRRRSSTALELGATIAGTFALFYASISNFGTQYFAWSMPFWMLAGWRFALAANLSAGAYIYWIYAVATDDWLLRGKFDYVVHLWPAGLTVVRDLALLTFVVFAAAGLVRAVATELAAWRARSNRVHLAP